jgi:two-component system KDP operon response regulator KdpE
MLTILCADDDEYLTKLLRHALEREGFKALPVHTGRETLRAVRTKRVDLILLDTTMSDLSGRQVLDRLRSFSPVPVIMLASRMQEQEDDEIASFQLGADDYAVKPFNIQVLMKRVGAVLRRTAGLTETRPSHEMIYRRREFLFDLSSSEIVEQGIRVKVTPTERQILRLLFLHQGHVLSKAQILDHIRGSDGDGNTGVVKTHVSHLRQKMRDLPEGAQLICTIPRTGYMLRSSDERDYTPIREFYQQFASQAEAAKSLPPHVLDRPAVVAN